jgi:hypothetical protein
MSYDIAPLTANAAARPFSAYPAVAVLPRCHTPTSAASGPSPTVSAAAAATCSAAEAASPPVRAFMGLLVTPLSLLNSHLPVNRIVTCT